MWIWTKLKILVSVHKQYKFGFSYNWIHAFSHWASKNSMFLEQKNLIKKLFSTIELGLLIPSHVNKENNITVTKHTQACHTSNFAKSY